MATNAHRAQALCDAMLNRTATQAEINRLGQALARNSNRYQEYTAASQEGKAGILIACARVVMLNLVKATEAQVASQTAANNAVLNVDTDFAESP